MTVDQPVTDAPEQLALMPIDRQAQPSGEKLVLSLVALFFLSQLIFVLPHNRATEMLLPLVKPELSLLGLSEKWNMFAPQVRKINLHGEAIIEFSDGSVALTELPRFDRLNDSLLRRSERFSKEKLRKLCVDHLPARGFEPFLEDMARFALREYLRGQPTPAGAAKRPLTVTLVVDWRAIEGPDEQRWQKLDTRNLKSDREHGQHHTLIVYDLTAEDQQ